MFLEMLGIRLLLFAFSCPLDRRMFLSSLAINWFIVILLTDFSMCGDHERRFKGSLVNSFLFEA